MFAGEHAAGEVDVQHPLPVGGRGLGHAALVGDASGIDQHIDTPEAADDFAHHLLHAGFITHIQTHEQAGKVRRGLANVQADHLGTLGQEAAHARQADTRCAAGDHGDLVVQTSHN
ncbi:hypothetical protein D3C79_777590 [compost metagenome]